MLQFSTRMQADIAKGLLAFLSTSSQVVDDNVTFPRRNQFANIKKIKESFVFDIIPVLKEIIKYLEENGVEKDWIEKWLSSLTAKKDQN